MLKKHSITYLTNFFPLEFGAHNPTLRTICDPVATGAIDEDATQLLCEALRELMWEYDGV
jgi:hypothetical protein